MRRRAYKILLVEPEPRLLEVLVSSFTRRFDAHITCVAQAGSCLDVELVDPHDLIIAEWTLSDGDGLMLAERLLSLGPRPVVLLVDRPRADDAIAAMRLGVSDMFRKPFPVEELLDAADRLLREQTLRTQRAVKYRRMRELVRHVIHERRDLNRRIELVCKDLVGAQRRLVHRVVDLEESLINRS